jgi:hypothetical protein
MIAWLRRRRAPRTSYWINGHGPFATRDEMEQMHTLLREVSDWNRAVAFIEHPSPHLGRQASPHSPPPQAP